jgi:hypothetical protein
LYVCRDLIYSGILDLICDLIDGWNEKEGMMLLSLRDVVLSIVI